MTPLAHKALKALTLPVKKRPPFIRQNDRQFRDLLTDVHCFEISAAVPLIADLHQSQFAKLSVDEFEDVVANVVFLPAPKTVIEWIGPARRVGVVLEQQEDTTAAVSHIVDGNDGDVVVSHIGWISTVSGDIRWTGAVDGKPAAVAIPPEFIQRGMDPGDYIRGILAFCHMALAVINSPRIVGRRQHMPHRALEKALTSEFGVGKFPLLAWTEILLNVSKPTEIDDGEPHEAHLTGRRALHFCRKHIRIRNGRLEYVRAHWRGDPALGIKQSRYTVTA